jgi:hypothetical protein
VAHTSPTVPHHISRRRYLCLEHLQWENGDGRLKHWFWGGPGNLGAILQRHLLRFAARKKYGPTMAHLPPQAGARSKDNEVQKHTAMAFYMLYSPEQHA